jgi:hypothetical protein
MRTAFSFDAVQNRPAPHDPGVPGRIEDRLTRS